MEAIFFSVIETTNAMASTKTILESAYKVLMTALSNEISLIDKIKMY